MLINIITGESETDKDAMDVCSILAEKMDVKEINRKVRFTPFGEETETSVLLKQRREQRGVINA